MTSGTKTAGARGRGRAEGDALDRRVVAVLERAAACLGWEPWSGDGDLEDHVAATTFLDLASEIVAGCLQDDAADLDRARVAMLAALLVDIEATRRAVRERLVETRVEAITGVQAGLARLRGIGSVASMIERAPMEVCRACGFDRAILFRVLDATLVAESVHVESDSEWARSVLDAARAQPAPLDHVLLETEMIRRRMPMLVRDPQHDPRVYRVVAEVSGTRSYVAAPIMPEGRVIGFLHADRYFQSRPVDEFDRDVLWTFAEGFGYAFERTVLLERMRAQRDQVRGMVDATEQLMAELCDTEIEVARVESEDSATAGRTAQLLAGEPSRLDQLLTRREIEVISLMAAGETNAGIAARLVISEGTVKSHVKHILRKLRAANRAEAVSRYLRIHSLES